MGGDTGYMEPVSGELVMLNLLQNSLDSFSSFSTFSHRKLKYVMGGSTKMVFDTMYRYYELVFTFLYLIIERRKRGSEDWDVLDIA